MKTYLATIHIILVLLITGLISKAQEKSIKDETFLHFAAMAETGYPRQFRGTNCFGVAPAGAHPPVSLLPDKNLAWKTEIASRVSSPCVWENSVFLTGFVPYDRQLTTYCIDFK